MRENIKKITLENLAAIVNMIGFPAIFLMLLVNRSAQMFTFIIQNLPHLFIRTIEIDTGVYYAKFSEIKAAVGIENIYGMDENGSLQDPITLDTIADNADVCVAKDGAKFHIYPSDGNLEKNNFHDWVTRKPVSLFKKITRKDGSELVFDHPSFQNIKRPTQFTYLLLGAAVIGLVAYAINQYNKFRLPDGTELPAAVNLKTLLDICHQLTEPNLKKACFELTTTFVNENSDPSNLYFDSRAFKTFEAFFKTMGCHIFNSDIVETHRAICMETIKRDSAHCSLKSLITNGINLRTEHTKAVNILKDSLFTQPAVIKHLSFPTEKVVSHFTQVYTTTAHDEFKKKQFLTLLPLCCDKESHLSRNEQIEISMRAGNFNSREEMTAAQYSIAAENFRRY